jgi:tetratricopeptide (TPR) repeat protein
MSGTKLTAGERDLPRWPSRVRTLLLAAVIVLAGGWVFAPAFRGGWLWDDSAELLQNGEVRAAGGLGRIWWAPSSPDYFPLKSTVQWLQWRLWGDGGTTGYHLTNVALHLLSALLVWRLFRRFGLRLAWLGGLLFAVHPVTVESVAWITELKNALSLPLLLLAMDAYLDYDERGRWPDYLRSLLWFVAAMLSKSSVVMLPAVLLLHAWWKRGRVNLRDLRAAAAFGGVSLALGLVTVWFQQHRSIGSGELVVGGFLSRFAGAGLAVSFYLSKCLWPVGLLPVYPRWSLDPPSPLQFLPWLVIVAALGWFWSRRAAWGRHALLGAGFFLINLVPVLGFIKMSYQYISWVADHFVYLPLIGVIGLAVAGAGAAIERLKESRRPYAFGTIAVVCVLLAVQSHRYAGIFRDEKTLWTYTVQNNPGAVVARNNLAKVLVDAGRVQEGMVQYEAALRIDPRSPGAHANLGNVLIQSGKLAEGMAHEEEALRLKPDYAAAYSNLGNAFLQSGKLAEAVARYEEALKFDAGNPLTHANLGNALLQAGRTETAIAQFELALRGQPTTAADIQASLGVALARMGRVGEAIEHGEAALRLKPDDARAQYNLACTLALANRIPEAVAHYEAAVRIKPGFAEAHNNLGLALARSGRPAEAADHFEQALRAKPDYAEAHLNLGNVRFRAGQLAEAVGHYEAALRINPGLADAHFNLGNALLQAGRLPEAISHFEATLRISPDDSEARRGLETAQQRLGAAGR